jgi:hypothetical protein
VRRVLTVTGTLLVAAAGIAPANAAQGFLNCASNGYKYNYCNADTQGRVVMVREVSTGNLCRQGRGWGYDNGGIWVDRGCRAEFSYGRDNRNWSGGGHWNGPGTLTCESVSYRYRRCDADTQNRVNLMRELSTGNLCRQGYGWGYDNRGIWVDRGCRGEFSYGRGSDGGSRHNDAAIAAGIIGALAIGAVISSSQSAAANTAASAPPAAPPPPAVAAQSPPAWAIGSYHAYDSDSGDIAQLVVDGGGRVYLRDENGNVVNQGGFRDGLVTWSNGKQSFLAREGPGVMLGDVDSGKHYYFRRNS